MQSPSTLTGILVTALFGAIAIGGMVWGIIHFAMTSHEDLHSFPVVLERNAAGTTTAFPLTGGQEVSVWLLMDSRVLELKPVTFNVVVESADGRRQAEVGQDFQGMTLRNRYGDHVYYRLGKFTPAASGDFRLNFKRGGDWASAPAGKLVVRRSLPFTVPWPAAALLVIGVVGVLYGVRMLLAVARGAQG